MVCHAEYSWLVSCTAVSDVDCVVISKGISNNSCNCTWESHVTVWIYDSKLDSLSVDLLCIINLILPSLCTTVKTVVTVVLVKHYSLTVELELTVSDTVCITTDRSTEVAWLCHVVVDVVETEDNVNHVAILVRNHYRNETATEVGNAHLHSVCIGQCIKCSCLTVLLAYECLRIETRKSKSRLA